MPKQSRDKRAELLNAIEYFWARNGSRSLAIRGVLADDRPRTELLGVDPLTSQTCYTHFRHGWAYAVEAAGLRLADDYTQLVDGLGQAVDVDQLLWAWGRTCVARPAVLRLAMTGRSLRGLDGAPVASAQVRDASEQLAVLVGGQRNYATLLGLTWGVVSELLTWDQFTVGGAAKLG